MDPSQFGDHFSLPAALARRRVAIAQSCQITYLAQSPWARPRRRAALWTLCSVLRRRSHRSPRRPAEALGKLLPLAVLHAVLRWLLPDRHRNPPPRPYGSNGWGTGPAPELPVPEEPGTTPLQFGPYTSVVEDDTTDWNMGGNGLVPYGEFQSEPGRRADIVDEIPSSRPRGRGHARLLRVPPVEKSPRCSSA